MRLWDDGGGSPVDGLIVADPVVFARLSARSGGLTVPGVGTISPADTLRFVGLEAYAVYEDDDDERKRVLGGVATAAFTEALEILGDDELLAAVGMLADIAAGEHLRVHVTDRQVQEVFERAGVTGSLPSTEGESVGVFVNNFAANKVDFFTHRAITHRIELLGDGSTEAEVDVTFTNDAPQEGYPRAVLGPWAEGAEAGDNISFVTVSCSRSCQVLDAPDGSSDGGQELDRPMIDHTLFLGAGARDRLRYRTQSSGAWQVVDGAAVLDVEHLVQPTIHGSDLTVAVRIPPDMVPAEIPEGAEVGGEEVVWAVKAASGRVLLRFSFVPASAADG
jgi:hypothetical protein